MMHGSTKLKYYSFIVIMICNVVERKENNECAAVDMSLHFLFVCLSQKGLTMDYLINPKHVANVSG
jgi:hypothetical protein